MHIILLKYVQLFCITVFFTNNVNCDELFVENSNEEMQLYQLAACTMNCIKINELVSLHKFLQMGFDDLSCEVIRTDFQ
jgi:hypothetical protein